MEKLPVPIPSPDGSLALRPDTLLANIEEAKALLVQTTDLAQIKGIHDVAEATAVFARARASRDAYFAAAEVKLWAERRVGQIRKELPRKAGGQRMKIEPEEARRLHEEEGWTLRRIGEHMGVAEANVWRMKQNGWASRQQVAPLSEFDTEIGIDPTVARQWEKLSEIPEPEFVRMLTLAKERDQSMVASTLVRKAGLAKERRIEPGIFQTVDGRLAIQWTKDRVQHKKTLDTTDLEVARRELAIRRGKIRRGGRVNRGEATVGDVYALIRRALSAADQVLPELEPDVRRALEESMGHLHKAEDATVRAINSMTGGRKKPRLDDGSRRR